MLTMVQSMRGIKVVGDEQIDLVVYRFGIVGEVMGWGLESGYPNVSAPSSAGSAMTGQSTYGRIVTRVWMGTREANASTSSLYIRMHPCDTSLPMEEGSFVPWMP